MTEKLVEGSALRLEWMEDGLCRQVGGDLWHPDEGIGSTWATNRAKEVCAECPVQLTCLRFALENREMYGIWGGTTQSERRKLLRLTSRSA